MASAPIQEDGILAQGPHAVLVDLYGTLVAGDDAATRAVAQRVCEARPADPDTVRERWGAEFASLLRHSSGDAFLSHREMERRALANATVDLNLEPDLTWYLQPLYRYLRRPRVVPGARAFLSALGVPTAVVTNADAADAAAAMSLVGAGVDCVITSEDVRAYKPDAAPFCHALAALGVQATDALFVGDSWSVDVVGAMNVGIPVAWITGSRSREATGAVPYFYRASSLVELLSILPASVKRRGMQYA